MSDEKSKEIKRYCLDCRVITTNLFKCTPCWDKTENIYAYGDKNLAPLVLDNDIGKALKYDGDKPDLSQVSAELMEHLARVRMFGEKKYARNNWKKGFKVTRSLAAALRHIFATLRGELYDPESGLLHVAHAIASLEHALYDIVYHKDNIDV